MSSRLEVPLFAMRWVVVSLVLVAGCTKRNREVCCTTEEDCARLNLPSGSVGNYGCGEAETCVELMCVPTEELPPDASTPDASTGPCDLTKDFGTPELVKGVNTGYDESSFTMMPDQLTAIVTRDLLSQHKLGVARRMSPTEDFGPPVDNDPMLAMVLIGPEQQLVRGGLTLLFSDRLGVFYVATRPAVDEAFSSGFAIQVENIEATTIKRARANSDGLTLYWVDGNDSMLMSALNRFGASSFYSPGQISTMPMHVFALSQDELTLLYKPMGTEDIYVSKRGARNAVFGPGTLVPALSALAARPLFTSQDDCALYLVTSSGASSDVHVARRGP